MKHLILATAAILSLATTNAALAQRPQVQLQQLAAGGGEHPTAETNRHGTQLAQGWHPQSHDNQASTNA